MESYNDNSSSDEESETTNRKRKLTKPYDELKRENQELRQEVKILKLRVSILEAEKDTAVITGLSNGGQNSHNVNDEHDSRLDSPPRGSPRNLTSDSPKAWNPFTALDRKRIVKYIKVHRFRNVGIRSGVWESMKNDAFSGSPHTVQSLENHFRRQILPKLDTVIPCKIKRAEFESQLESPSPAKKRKC